MKIAIIVSTFPPYLGGIGNVAFHQAKELAKLGYEVEVLTPNYKSKKFKQDDIEGVKVKRIVPLFKYGNAAYLPAVKRIIKEEKYNIVHLHYPFFGGAEFVGKAKKKYKFKLVLHYHMDTVGRGWKGAIFTLHTKFVLPKIVKLADKIIVTSFDYAKESQLKEFIGKKPQKFIEVANGVDIEKFSPKDKDANLMTRLNLEPFQKVILFVGGLDSAHYFKGVDYLIRAYKLLRATDLGKQTKLVIVGEGDLKPHYKDLTGQLNLFDHVVFIGGVSEDDLPKYYNLSDLVVLPSIDKSEAFGMALIEGMACAKPVIATNLPGVRTVVDDQKNGLLVKAKDAEDLATKMNHLLTNPDLSSQFGQQGRQKVEAKYSWGKFGQKIDQIYKSL